MLHICLSAELKNTTPLSCCAYSSCHSAQCIVVTLCCTGSCCNYRHKLCSQSTNTSTLLCGQRTGRHSPFVFHRVLIGPKCNLLSIRLTFHVFLQTGSLLSIICFSHILLPRSYQRLPTLILSGYLLILFIIIIIIILHNTIANVFKSPLII